MPTMTNSMTVATNRRQLIAMVQRLEEEQPALIAEAHTLVEEKKAAYQEWLRPQLAYQAALDHEAHVRRETTRTIEKTYSGLRNSADPRIDNARRTAVKWQQENSLDFRAGNEVQGGGNYAECDARRVAIQKAIGELDALKSADYGDDAGPAIARIMNEVGPAIGTY